MEKTMVILINSLAGGGAERQVSLLSNHLPIEKIILLEDEISYNVDRSKVVVLSEHSRKTSALWKMLLLPWYCWRLQKVTDDPLVLSFLERSNFINVLSKLFFKHRALISVRIQPSLAYGKGLKRFEKLLIRWLYPFAEKIIVNSQGIQHDLVTNFQLSEDHIEVIHNSVDIEMIEKKAKEPLEPELKNLIQHPVILSVGRFISQKGQWRLIETFSQLRKKNPDLRLVLLGEGPLEAELRKKALELGLQEDQDIFFLPFRNNPYSLMAQSRLFVLPSLYEGFPNVLLEALACGVPVAATDCWSGPREILAPDSDPLKRTLVPEKTSFGLLLPVDDRRSWGEALESFLLHSDTVEHAKKRILEFHFSKLLKKWESTSKL